MLDGLSIRSATNRYFTLQVQVVKSSVKASQVFPLETYIFGTVWGKVIVVTFN